MGSQLVTAVASSRALDPLIRLLSATTRFAGPAK
jgi:hypothetical protein